MAQLSEIRIPLVIVVPVTAKLAARSGDSAARLDVVPDWSNLRVEVQRRSLSPEATAVTSSGEG